MTLILGAISGLAAVVLFTVAIIDGMRSGTIKQPGYVIGLISVALITIASTLILVRF